MTAHSSPVQARRHPFGKLEGEEMRNPRVSAAVSIAGIVIVGSMMLFSTEAPSGALTVLQWLLLAGCIIGLVGSLLQMARGRD
jgi:hypothetical protein